MINEQYKHSGLTAKIIGNGSSQEIRKWISGSDLSTGIGDRNVFNESLFSKRI